jgi:hypothetical protein
MLWENVMYKLDPIITGYNSNFVTEIVFILITVDFWQIITCDSKVPFMVLTKVAVFTRTSIHSNWSR